MMLTKQAANNNRDHTKCETFLIAKERNQNQLQNWKEFQII